MAQVARAQGRSVYAFTRHGDAEAQRLARSLGAEWAGASEDTPPAELDAAIIYAPVGPLVPLALRAVRKGGRVVCAGIHMSDIPAFPYHILWGERQIVSVANLTRKDGIDFLAGRGASEHPDPHHASFRSTRPMKSLAQLRDGQTHRRRGAAAVTVSTSTSQRDRSARCSISSIEQLRGQGPQADRHPRLDRVPRAATAR